MKTIAVLNLKGGCGKTTITVHSAVAAEETGKRVLIVDCDPQKSAWKWSQQRKQETPVVVAQPVYELAKVLEAAEQEGMDVAFVDTAPALTAEAGQVVKLADLVVVPIRPTALDLEAAMETIRMMTALKVRRCWCCLPVHHEPRRLRRRGRYWRSFPYGAARSPTAGHMPGPWPVAARWSSLRRTARQLRRSASCGSGSQGERNDDEEEGDEQGNRVAGQIHQQAHGKIVRSDDTTTQTSNNGGGDLTTITIRMSKANWMTLKQFALHEGRRCKASPCRASISGWKRRDYQPWRNSIESCNHAVMDDGKDVRRAGVLLKLTQDVSFRTAAQSSGGGSQKPCEQRAQSPQVKPIGNRWG